MARTLTRDDLVTDGTGVASAEEVATDVKTDSLLSSWLTEAVFGALVTAAPGVTGAFGTDGVVGVEPAPCLLLAF